MSSSCYTMTDSAADALREMVNMGMGKAAAAISEITTREIHVDVPIVEVLESFRGQHLSDLSNTVALRVVMPFVGSYNGHAMLVLSQSGAAKLIELLIGQAPVGEVFDENEQSALLEVGNITLNRVVGLLLNQLGGEVEYQLPQLQLRGIKTTIDLVSDLYKEDEAGGMLMRAALRIHDTGIVGYLLVILPPAELLRLIQKVTEISEQP